MTENVAHNCSNFARFRNSLIANGVVVGQQAMMWTVDRGQEEAEWLHSGPTGENTK